MLLSTLTLGGCAGWQAGTECACAAQQQELARLQHVVATQAAEINRLHAQQQDQVKELQETSSLAARAEVKLRRFATEADVASRLAEVEVAMEGLHTKLDPGRTAPLQATVQRLLEQASTAFERGELNEAAELASQAEQLIEMLMDDRPPAAGEAAPEVPFRIAVPLRTRTDTRLRRHPDLEADVVTVLRRSTPVVVHGYRGEWLRVQTGDGISGWVAGDLLEPR